MSNSQKKKNGKSDSQNKRKKSASQKCATEFEDLCVAIVTEILGDSLKEIIKTSKSKDGGYDIDTAIQYNKQPYGVLFECKLRGNKVNLRDIAANVIIAYNKCADSLVIMTNNTFTPQLEQELCSFRDSCQLNIKVATGSGIENVVKGSNISLSSELLELIKKEKDNKDIKRESTLILNLDSKDICKQILEKPLPESFDKESDFISKVYSKDFNRAISLIKNNNSIMVQGYIGTGKSAFIRKIISTSERKCIRLNAELFRSQEQVILYLIRIIWGLPDIVAGDKFEKYYADNVIGAICGSISPETCEFIKTILIEASLPAKIEANSILCKYLVSLINQHRNKTRYIVYFDNFHAANQEVRDLFVYLSVLFSNNGIPCIIETNKSEYDIHSWNYESLNKLIKYEVIEIEPLSREYATEWFMQELKIESKTAEEIIKHVGTRFYNMIHISKELKEKMPTLSFQVVMKYLAALTPNDMPSIMANSIREFKANNKTLFTLLKITNCQVPIRLYREFAESYTSFANKGIIAYDSGYIIASNEFVKQAVKNEVTSPMDETSIAETIIKFCNKNPRQYKETKVYGLFYANRWNETIKEIDQLISDLGQKRNFMQMLDLIELAITISEKEHNHNALAHYLIKKLEVNATIKSLAFDNARATVRQLEKVVDSGQLDLSTETLAELALCHFNGVISFRDCKFQDEILDKHLKYYNNCLNGTMRENPGDYLGKVCWNYALYIKETQGNSAALKVFDAAFGVLPDSHKLQIGYLSHLACISLPSDPQKSYGYYSKIIELVNSGQTFYNFPFHEYGDKAMCKLLLKEAGKALEHVEVGIKYAESHGVYDEVGRILNIKGCALLLSGKVPDAVKCFREATEIMEYSGYNLYRWRSELNYVNYSLSTGNKEELRKKLLDAYSVFKAGSMKKVRNLIRSGDDFLSSREYLALLVVGKCSRKLFNTDESIISTEKVAEEFSLPDKIKEHYFEITEQLADRRKKLTFQSIYVYNENIFIIG